MMEESNKIPNIELRSEGVQELMGRIPPAILRTGITVVLAILLAAVGVSYFVKYPDVMKVDVSLSNANEVEFVNAPANGTIYKVIIEQEQKVLDGDTLAVVVTPKDTMPVIAHMTGKAYPCCSLLKGDHIDSETVCYIVADTIYSQLTARARVSSDVQNRMKTGMQVETTVGNAIATGVITQIAKHPNPFDGTYAIAMRLDTPAESQGVVFHNYRSTAKMNVSEHTIFEHIFSSAIYK